jgi:DMSO/TMAO reductase YedYZ heme-binding membrane subunit
MALKKEGICIIASTIILYILILVLIFLEPIKDGLDFIIRFGALMGFTSMFVATIMTPFMVQLYKIFGKPFIKIHHLYSIAGLILITLHPVAFAISKLDITIFVPVFYPWYDFWSLGGRVALILIYLAVLGSLLRKKIKNWRIIHILNYIALFLAYIHGVLIGTDFKTVGILIIFTAMLVLSFGVLIFKRYLSYKRKKKD